MVNKDIERCSILIASHQEVINQNQNNWNENLIQQSSMQLEHTKSSAGSQHWKKQKQKESPSLTLISTNKERNWNLPILLMRL